MKDKVNEVTQSALNKANEVTNEAMKQADILYNKLPLDKINEKLGGKVDVKSKKFKLIAGCSALTIVFVLIVSLFFGGQPDPVWIDFSNQNELNFINALNSKQKRIYFLTTLFCIDNKLDVNHVKNTPRAGKRYSELLKIWREKMGSENRKKLDEYISKSSATEPKAFIEAYIKRLEHRIWAETTGKRILSQEYNAECIKLNVAGWNTGDTKDTVWMDAVAVFRSNSGQEIKMFFEVTSSIDHKLLLFTAKD